MCLNVLSKKVGERRLAKEGRRKKVDVRERRLTLEKDGFEGV